MLNAELSPSALAEAVQVDVKTVMRWVADRCTPYPATRTKISHVLGQRETFLWPSLLDQSDATERARDELERVWPTRSSIPTETWHSLFSSAAKQLDILVYAGGFLVETLDLADVLRWKASAGTAVRVLVGEPSSPAVRLRATEISQPWLPERCASTASYLEDVTRESAIDVRSHATTLYASLFRFDDVLLVNPHALGAWAAHSPALQLRQSSQATLFDFYAGAFERVWRTGSSRCRR